MLAIASGNYLPQEPNVDDRMQRFLTAFQLHMSIEACTYVISRFYEIGLDFGFADAITKKTFLVLLGKLQAALIKAQNGSAVRSEDVSAAISEVLAESNQA